jgi:alpha-beta hydrolase superfamily lysophospholipase
MGSSHGSLKLETGGSEREGGFRAAGGPELFYRVREPDGPPRAALVLVHGFGEHSGRYRGLAEPLSRHGIRVYGFDHRGHGRSPGPRGHIDAWSDYRQDTHAALALATDQGPGLPLFLYGHSMGALVVLDYVLRHPDSRLDGVIVSSAPIDPAGVGSPTLVRIVRILSRLWPTVPLRLGLDTTAISSDEAVVRAYRADPLVHGRITPRWGVESMAALDFVRQHAAGITRPILFVHGQLDRLHRAEGVQRFSERVGSPDRQVLVLPGAFHEPHNDRAAPELAAAVARWISERIPPPRSMEDRAHAPR